MLAIKLVALLENYFMHVFEENRKASHVYKISVMINDCIILTTVKLVK